MKLVYDDKTGTWGEAPEVYGTIECATKEDYEYVKEAIKGYKELEAKHWDECRQIAHYDNELKKAKRLLKLALQDMNSNNICYDINACNVCTENKCISCNTFRWRYADEALKLIGELRMAEYISRETAFVQPAVHCKDCKYAQNPNDTMVYCTYFECGTMSQNDFCSQGERRAENG